MSVAQQYHDAFRDAMIVVYVSLLSHEKNFI
jgi:hypothetical protein